MSMLQRLTEWVTGTPDVHPLREDDPDDLPTLRRLVTDLGSQNRQLTMERDCFEAELLRTKEHTKASLAMRVKMYKRALFARVRAAKAVAL